MKLGGTKPLWSRMQRLNQMIRTYEQELLLKVKHCPLVQGKFPFLGIDYDAMALRTVVSRQLSSISSFNSSLRGNRILFLFHSKPQLILEIM